jgi:hypothetical protein
MTDTFRKNPKELTMKQKECVKNVKSIAEQMYETLEYLVNEEGAKFPAHREVDIAKTKLEECVMWAVKGITT